MIKKIPRSAAHEDELKYQPESSLKRRQLIKILRNGARLGKQSLFASARHARLLVA